VIGGVLIGLPSLRIRGLYLALATFGAYFIVIYIGQRYQNADAGPAGFVLRPLFGGTDESQQHIWAVLLTGLVALTALVTDRLTADRIGRALRLIRDQEAAAPALGIDVTKYKLAVFVVSSVITGIAGSIGAEFVGNVSTDNYTLTLAIAYLAMILIGGFDSVTGAIVGAAAVTLLPIMVVRVLTATAGSQYATLHGTEISSIIYGLVIVVLATRAPGGLSALAETAWRAPGRARASRRRLRTALDES
jgi:branched-chain amino acid transport system permease protein